MVARRADPDEVVIRDSRPLQVVLIGFPGVVLAASAITTPRVGVPFLAAWAALTATSYRRPRKPTIANADGITGLRLRVSSPGHRSWFVRHKVIGSVVPWDRVEDIHVGASPLSLSAIRVRLTDRGEADLPANAITRRGLQKIAADLERLRGNHPADRNVQGS